MFHQIKRMNYDIHTGAAWGLPGRIALFFTALIIAGLSVTGFYIWWGKRKKLKQIIHRVDKPVITLRKELEIVS